MKSVMSCAGPKRRFLVFLYLTCFTFSLTPTNAASPERAFVRGQPELQQAMDNMLAREQVIKRNLQFPSGDVDGYPALLTHKTTNLLAEAEHMLNRVKNLRERRWVEAFVHRLKILASVLERSVSEKSNQNKGMNYTVKENNKYLSRKFAPESHFQFTPATLPASTPPDIKREQKSVKMTSKNPTTSSQLNQVLPMSYYQSAEAQVVTKPGLIQQLRNKKSDEGDELVRELENLHNVVALENQPQNDIPPVTTSPLKLSSETPPAKRTNLIHENDPEVEDEKIKDIIIQEVAALQRLGITPEEIMNTLRFDAEKFAGNKDPEIHFNQKENSEKQVVHPIEADKKTVTEQNMGAKVVNSEESMISKTNKHVWRPSTFLHPANHPSKEMYMNNSLHGIHLNLPLMNQQILTRQLKNGLSKNSPRAALHLYHNDGIKNAIQRLQIQHQNHQLKNQMIHGQQKLQNDLHGIPAPDSMKQNHFIPYNNKYNSNPAVGLYHSGARNRHDHSPYPYSPYLDHKNATMHGTQVFPNHNIDKNLSDEMKRQLRDGKVILLSDSVVVSNFEPTLEKDKDEKDKEGAPDQVIGPDRKNETQAQN